VNGAPVVTVEGDCSGGGDEVEKVLAVVTLAVEGPTDVLVDCVLVGWTDVLGATEDVEELEPPGPTVTPPTVIPVAEVPGQFSVMISVVGPVG
jgi:hypothetical protein